MEQQNTQESQMKNHENNHKVQRVNTLFKELADIVSEHYQNKNAHPVEVIKHNHVLQSLAGTQFQILDWLTYDFEELVNTKS